MSVTVTTDTGIQATLSNGGTDAAGPYVATMTMGGLGPAPTVGVADFKIGVRSYAPPTGVGANAGAAMTAAGFALYLAFQAACMAAGKQQTGMSLMRIQQLIEFATLATTGAYVKAGGT